MVKFEHEEAATELIQEDSHPMVNIAIQVKPEAVSVLPQQKVEVGVTCRKKFPQILRYSCYSQIRPM